jgi:hypothetical protein
MNWKENEHNAHILDRYTSPSKAEQSLLNSFRGSASGIIGPFGIIRRKSQASLEVNYHPD